MKIALALICLVTSVHFFGGGIHLLPKIGKDLYYRVEQGQVVDADYIEKVLDYEDRGLIREFYQHESEMHGVDIEDEVAKGDVFGLYRAHVKELIDFMRKNNLKIAPGQYMFNQTWGFRDGKFVINKFIGQNEIEVFKFEKK